ncbi:MAG: hypothetical protein PUI79_07875 [Campylobacteraceae bacterium]|nr:hypothetical protein [Campylobacteraceae bacterium]MDY4451667.1 hypothetical protein [Campylobacter sp.]
MAKLYNSAHTSLGRSICSTYAGTRLLSPQLTHDTLANYLSCYGNRRHCEGAKLPKQSR